MSTRSAKGSPEGSEQRQEKPRSADQNKSGQLTAHQQFESVAKGLVAISDTRLNSLLNAVVENRKTAISQAADVLEAVQTGELDIYLLAAELETRNVEPVDVPSFRVPSDALDIPAIQHNLDALNQLAGVTARAIAGV